MADKNWNTSYYLGVIPIYIVFFRQLLHRYDDLANFLLFYISRSLTIFFTIQVKLSTVWCRRIKQITILQRDAMALDWFITEWFIDVRKKTYVAAERAQQPTIINQYNNEWYHKLLDYTRKLVAYVLCAEKIVDIDAM